MTTTTKVEGRTYADLATWAKRFDKRAMRELAAYMSSYNMESQAVAFADENPSTTGTKPCFINGLPIVSLPVEDDADWDNADTAVSGDAQGTTLTNGQSVWLLVLAASDGTLTVNLASEVAADADVELKIPAFDASTLVPLALVLVDAAGNVTLGTTDINAIVTIYQLTGPVLPHPDNFQN